MWKEAVITYPNILSQYFTTGIEDNNESLLGYVVTWLRF